MTLLKAFVSAVEQPRIPIRCPKPLFLTCFGLPIPNHKAPKPIELRYRSICSPI